MTLRVYTFESGDLKGEAWEVDDGYACRVDGNVRNYESAGVPIIKVGQNGNRISGPMIELDSDKRETFSKAAK